MSFLSGIRKLANYMRRDGDAIEGVERTAEPEKSELREYRDEQQALRGEYLAVRSRRKSGDAPTLAEPTARPEQAADRSFRRISGG